MVCPATLTLKWKAEMAEKFGLDFTIVDSECLRQLRRTQGIAANPFRVYPLTIVSLQWLPGPRAERILNEFLPERPTYPRAFDLLIVDEAHHIAPKAPKASYAVDSDQTRSIRRLAEHFEHRLFLSATPHNGYRESWTALLAILDPLRFARGVLPDPEVQQQAVIRRMKDAIPNPDGSPRFPKRVVEALSVEYSETDREIHALLQAFTELRRQRAGEGPRGRRSTSPPSSSRSDFSRLRSPSPRPSTTTPTPCAGRAASRTRRGRCRAPCPAGFSSWSSPVRTRPTTS